MTIDQMGWKGSKPPFASRPPIARGSRCPLRPRKKSRATMASGINCSGNRHTQGAARAPLFDILDRISHRLLAVCRRPQVRMHQFHLDREGSRMATSITDHSNFEAAIAAAWTLARDRFETRPRVSGAANISKRTCPPRHAAPDRACRRTPG